MNFQIEEPVAKQNFEGFVKCSNPRCRRPLHKDYVSLIPPLESTLPGTVRLCGPCWEMPLDRLPEVQEAAARAFEQWKLLNPEPKT